MEIKIIVMDKKSQPIEFLFTKTANQREVTAAIRDALMAHPEGRVEIYPLKSNQPEE